MGATNIYRVRYHFEGKKDNATQQKISPDYEEYVSAAGSDFDSIRTVLNNNSKLRGSGQLVIDQVVNVGITGVLT